MRGRERFGALPVVTRYSLLPLLFLASPLCAQEPAPPESPTAAKVQSPWPFQDSDIPVDPEFRFGQFANGMRYIIRQNDRPEQTALVRMVIGSGSLAETDAERGLAHFLEHMAFNGSTNVPEGEMVKLLEREGLAFGADTNASTGFEETVYKLDLPRSDPALLDTALMLMRETASELLIAPEAVDRERGVILSERRDRTNFSLKDTLDQFEFTTPGARYGDRLPIGVPAVLETASADDLRKFYRREYVPANTVVLVVGDFDEDLIKAAIEKHFSSWQAAPLPPEPAAGPVDVSRAGVTDIHLDPALSERITVTRLSSWQNEPDLVANRRQNLLRSIGYGIVNRRLLAQARSAEPPFRGAGFGTGDIFEEARSTNLVIDSADGEWSKGLTAAAFTLRQALHFGFTKAEVAEQVAGALTAQENAAASAGTRTNASLMGTALSLVSDEQIPSTPASGLERLRAFLPYITPAAVLEAVRRDAAPLDNPLIRFRGRTMPEGGFEALRRTWDATVAGSVEPLAEAEQVPFGYTDFGPPGAIVSDTVEPRLGIRQIRFENGVMLNLKRTELQEDRIAFEINLDGGSLLNTPENPLATAMVPVLPVGGLGKHSQDELQSILAGRSVGWSLGTETDSFTASGTTTARDLALQLQLLTAGLTDPGYRREAEIQYRRNVANFFKSKDASPSGALGNALGGIISDNDPRFTLQPEDAYMALDFAKLRDVIGGRLASGALEVALVGDLEEQAAIDLVAASLGALPRREAEFRPRTEARQRAFTADRTPRMLRHSGEADQALLRLTWPTTDDSDLALDARLTILERVVRLALQEELRERLGKTYSPSANSSTSRDYSGYGTFAIAASVDVADVGATREAIAAALKRLRGEAIDTDMLDRARRPLLETYDNALKSNGGWLGLVSRAQSESERITRFLRAREVIAEVTTEEIRQTADRFLQPGALLEVLVIPEQGDQSQE
ncbi:M16 family metallopeptidase [Allopontixanthobacter sediminis]|uniref:Insulinase family protein n=1 Tax=Allopontixanthobacter sediminis TaxID=1689985 RepID=A0A845B2B4_9SPHN|nr:insulinase family protein [Allopontixanthobacter sediminis]MXP45401.1 insulinase family protein [Allopontixanthobacter sediminis]